MNRKILLTLSLLILVLACNKEKQEVVPSTSSATQAAGSGEPIRHITAKCGDSTGWSPFITLDVANQMISSYLYSIQNDPNMSLNAPDVKGFTMNADSLRAYLQNSQVTNIKIIFAHTMSYINKGNYGVYAGYQAGAMTIIIAGYDVNGNYVYYSPGAPQPANSPYANQLNATGTLSLDTTNGQNVPIPQYVLDHAIPCPYSCPPGTAGADLLQ